MSRLVSRLSAGALLTALLVVPTSSVPPAHAAATGVEGSTGLAASATGPGASTDTATPVSSSHDGNFPDTSVETMSEGETGTAQVHVDQNWQTSATRIHVGGTTIGARGGGTNSATNQASFSFTPPTTAQWDVTIDGMATSSTGNGVGCPFGAHVSFTGLGNHDIPCTSQLVLVQKRMTLTAGTTYTFDGGHGSVGDVDGSFFFAFEATRVAPVANTKPPTISGQAKVGKRLTATRGSWAGSPTTFAFQWYRGTAKVAGATKATYTCAAKDKGKKLKVVVTASKPGSSASKASQQTGAVRR